MNILINYIRQYPNLKQFIKFGFVGSGSAGVNFIVLYLFTSWIGIWYLYSSILGYVISAIFNFTANKTWTFRNQEKGPAVVSQAFKFSFVIVVGLVVNTIFIYLLTDMVGFDYRVSWFIVTGFIAIWNFTMNRFWTFKHKPVDLSVGDL